MFLLNDMVDGNARNRMPSSESLSCIRYIWYIVVYNFIYYFINNISSHGLRSRSFETNAWTFRLCAITWRCWNAQIRDDAANDFLLIYEMEDYGICKDCLRQRDQGTLPLVLMLSILSRQDCALFFGLIITSDYIFDGMQGSPDTFEFRIFNYTADKDTVLSAWHDIPLYAGQGLLNFLCEIPKETSAKMELATDETRTPIKQDTKKGKLRHYPYNINWNYGMLPQTWEDPGHVDAELKAGVRCCCLLMQCK